MILALYHHVGSGPPRVHIPLADFIMLQHIGVLIAVNDHFVLHRRKHVIDHRQRLPFNLNQRSGLGCRQLRLRHNDGHLVTLPAADGRILRAAQPHQNRLVGHNQAIFIHRHVSGGEDCHHAWHGARLL